MSVEVYLCEKYKHRHERKAFGSFLQEMVDRFGDSSDLYVIVVEPEANTASMDMLVITHNALIIVELKELIRADGLSASDVILYGKEKGAWMYELIGESKYYIGEAKKEKNPYQQIKNHRYKLGEWLVNHSKTLPGGPWSKYNALKRLYAWMVISPGFDPEKSEIDLPWEYIKNNFKLLSLSQLAYEVGLATNSNLDLSDTQMREIANLLGATKVENLSEFIPNYVPPPSPLSFFGRPPIPKRVIDRTEEKKSLRSSLMDPQVSLISLGGPGGIGKTYLAAWLVEEALKEGYRYFWVECAEREVTAEAFLVAVADKMNNKYQAALIHDPEQRMTDKFDIVIEFLDQDKYLIVFNDYHKVTNNKRLDDFFTRVVQRARNLKILLTTRLRPNCLDTPEWAPGSSVEITLKGIPLDAIREFVDEPSLSEPQLRDIWERSSGNPYAIGLLVSLYRNRCKMDRFSELKLFDDVRAKEWAESLIETIPEEVQKLACKIAVVRSSLSFDLIERLAYAPREKTLTLVSKAIDAYILQELEAGQYQMHDYIREALLARANEGDIRKAHGTVGVYYERLINKQQGEADKIELMLQCLYHYENAQNWQGVLSQAPLIIRDLERRGEKDRLYSVTKSAVMAARASGDKLQLAYWLIKQIKLELDLSFLVAAKKNLNEALLLTPKKLKNATEIETQWCVYEAQLWASRGRLAYSEGAVDGIEKCFNEGMKLAEKASDLNCLAEILIEYARICRHMGELDKAEKLFSKAREHAETLDDKRLYYKCTSQLGLLARSKGELDKAKQLFALAYENSKSINDLYGEKINQGLIGDVALRAGDFHTAEKIFRELLEKERLADNSLGIRITLGWLAEALIGLGSLEEAEKLLSECAKKAEEVQDETGIAWVLKRRGLLEHARGNYEKGNGFIKQGISLLQKINNLVYVPDFERALVSTPISQQGIQSVQEGNLE